MPKRTSSKKGSRRHSRRQAGGLSDPVLFYNDTNRPLIYAWYRTSVTGSESTLLSTGVIESGTLKQPHRIPRPSFQVSLASRDLLISTLQDRQCAFPAKFPVGVAPVSHDPKSAVAATIKQFVRLFPDRYYLWTSPGNIIGARDLSLNDAKSAVVNCFGDQKCEAQVRQSIQNKMARDTPIASYPSPDCPLPRRFGGEGGEGIEGFTGCSLKHLVLQDLPFPVYRSAGAGAKKMIKDSGVGRVSKTEDARIHREMKATIEKSHLYAMAKITAVKEDKKTGHRTIEINHFGNPIGHVFPWIIIGNGDGNEQAQLVSFGCEGDPDDSKWDGLCETADVPPGLKMSSAKLKGAFLYFGPQMVKTDKKWIKLLFDNLEQIPKSRRKLPITPDLWIKLQFQASQ